MLCALSCDGVLLYKSTFRANVSLFICCSVYYFRREMCTFFVLFIINIYGSFLLLLLSFFGFSPIPFAVCLLLSKCVFTKMSIEQLRQIQVCFPFCADMLLCFTRISYSNISAVESSNSNLSKYIKYREIFVCLCALHKPSNQHS